METQTLALRCPLRLTGEVPPPSLAIFSPLTRLSERAAGRAVEVGVATGFVVVAAAGVTGAPWLFVGGLLGLCFKDLWQHRTHFVANTRWWPPFCLVVDWAAGTIVAVLIIGGVEFH